MTSQIIAMLAAAGMVTAGVAATVETRAPASLPSAQLAALPLNPVAGESADMGQKIDCDLDANKDKSECSDTGGERGNGNGNGVGGGGGGATLGIVAGVVGAGGLLVALGKKSPG